MKRDPLADIDAILNEVDQAVREVGADLYEDAVASVRDLLDGSDAYPWGRLNGPREMFWAPERREHSPALCGRDCEHGSYQQSLELPLIGGSPFDGDAYAIRGNDLVQTTLEQIEARARARCRGFSRHEVAFAGLDPSLAWSPLSDVIPAEGEAVEQFDFKWQQIPDPGLHAEMLAENCWRLRQVTTSIIRIADVTP